MCRPRKNPQNSMVSAICTAGFVASSSSSPVLILVELRLCIPLLFDMRVERLWTHRLEFCNPIKSPLSFRNVRCSVLYSIRLAQACRICSTVASLLMQQRYKDPLIIHWLLNMCPVSSPVTKVEAPYQVSVSDLGDSLPIRSFNCLRSLIVLHSERKFAV